MENPSTPLKVELTNPPIQDPWRTRAEYIEEQRQQKWQFRFTICALLVSIVASVSAVVSAYAAIRAFDQVASQAATKK